VTLTSLTIGGTEWISKLLYDGTEFGAELGGNIATATFVVQDSPGKINYCTWSEVIEEWSKANCTVTDDATTAPDGETTADKVVEAVSGSVEKAVYKDILAANGKTITFSAYAKAAERDHVILVVEDPGVSAWGAVFDLGGAVYKEAYGTPPAGSTNSIEDVGS